MSKASVYAQRAAIAAGAFTFVSSLTDMSPLSPLAGSSGQMRVMGALLSAVMMAALAGIIGAVVGAIMDSAGGQQSQPQDPPVVPTAPAKAVGQDQREAAVRPPPKQLDEFYVQALDEIELSTVDRAIWARALAAADGHEPKAISTYIKLRVADLTSGGKGEAVPSPPLAEATPHRDVSRHRPTTESQQATPPVASEGSSDASLMGDAKACESRLANLGHEVKALGQDEWEITLKSGVTVFARSVSALQTTAYRYTWAALGDANTCTAKLIDAGCTVSGPAEGPWSITLPSGAQSVASSLAALKEMTIRHALQGPAASPPAP